MTTHLIVTPDRAVGSCVTILKLIIINKINYNHLGGTTHQLLSSKHTGKTKLPVAESRKMIQKMEKDEYNDIMKHTNW